MLLEEDLTAARTDGANLLELATTHLLSKSLLRFGEALSAFVVCGSSASRLGISQNDLDVLILHREHWSQRMRGSYSHLPLDIRIDGVKMLEQDVQRGIDWRIDMVLKSRALLDSHGDFERIRQIAEVRCKAPLLMYSSDEFQPFDLLRKLRRCELQLEARTIAGLLIDSCLSVLLKRRGLRSGSSLERLRIAKQVDTDAWTIACKITEASSLSSSILYSKALAEHVLRRREHEPHTYISARVSTSLSPSEEYA